MTTSSEINVSVGDLTDLCRKGDINFRFSARSSAQEGIKGHQRVQKSREAGYQAEYSVSHVVSSSDFDITISGRIDGYNQNGDICYLDEIKTVRVHPNEIPDDVLDSYWLQASLYGFMLSRELDLDELLLRLCFYHLDEKCEYMLERQLTAIALGQIFVDATLLLVSGLERRRDWQGIRERSMEALEFPYDAYRAGQRDMAVSVYRAARSNEQLVVQAPTGIGKTMATIFPAVHALGGGVASRVFYLSAKNSTQQLAEKSAEDLGRAGARLRTVTLTAKDKICFSPGEPCDPNHCVYARGYYDRVSHALETMLDSRDQFDRHAIEDSAREHEICPFELGLDLSRHCDLIISDYNYVFDPVVYLRRFFDTNQIDSIGLIDEAHNLVDRGRDMFSATVDKKSYLSLARRVKGKATAIHRSAQAVNRAFLAHKKANQKQFEASGHIAEYTPPEKLIHTLQNFCSVAEEALRQEGQDSWREALLDVYFASLRFIRTAENFAEDYVALMLRGSKGQMTMRLYCVDPSNRLKTGFDRLTASVCFSATMQPQQYFQRMLGTGDACHWYRLPSPFAADNLHVNIAGFVDTTYTGRKRSVADVVSIVRTVVDARPGNYIVFFPSYDYLTLIFDNFVAAHPEINVIKQDPRMSDMERQAFLDRFGEDIMCGFAVMGGIFAEGVDLKGSRLIGAVVIGVGLPQLGIERDLIRDHFPEAGFEYAYQYPGMIKVLQTAGRVIRSETDQGIVCLVDQRYLQPRYRDLLPEQWQTSTSASCHQLKNDLLEFWEARS